MSVNVGAALEGILISIAGDSAAGGPRQHFEKVLHTVPWVDIPIRSIVTYIN